MNTLSRNALTLGLSFTLAVALLATVNALTRTTIQESKRDWTRENLTIVLPDGPYDNDPISSLKQHVAIELGSQEPLALYTLYRNGQPMAAALEVIANAGYNGDIRLLLGIKHSGEISGVRVIEHRETPGLGDDIDSDRSDWITYFNNHSLMQTAPPGWDVKKFGGQFDSFTGATITPRAIVLAIERALNWYEKNRDQIFST